MRNPRATWGIAGLLAFEAIIAAYTFGGNNLVFSAMYAIGAIVLGLALVTGAERWHFAILAAVSLYRAYLQTAGGAALGVYPTYLVPLGFAWLAIAPKTMPALALASVAIARTWFVFWYFLAGANVVAAANVLGAAGAWLWAAGAMTDARSEASAGDAASRT